MDFSAFSGKNLASCDCKTVFLWAYIFAFACTVARIGHLAYQYGIYWTKKCWYGFKQCEELPFHTDPLPALLCIILVHNKPPPQPFYGPFSRTTRVSRCQKRTSGLYDARED